MSLKNTSTAPARNGAELRRMNEMKIAIASDDRITVTQHFGRTRGFVVVTLDGETDSREYVENRHTQHVLGEEHNHSSQPQHAHGHSHDGILRALEGCSMVVAGGMGRRLRDDMDRVGVSAVITDQQTVDGVISALKAGSLQDHAGRSCNH
ncbi:MAG: iron-molybdenum cofactor biosynthesis protein [Ignavibacteria bacterium]|nr:MAG: iron-molybdenum cofactor biosynthesis protein [Ignavibacteria bacterium]